MKELKTPNLKKQYQNLITSKWIKRFLSNDYIFLLVIIGLGIIIFWLKIITTSGQFLLDILNILLMGILIKYLEQKKRITLLHQIRTRCISVLTNLLIKYSKEKKIKKKSWTSWIRFTDKIEPLLTSHIKNV